MFAPHGLDIGINTDFMDKLTPKRNDPAYAQSLPTPTNMKDKKLVEFALIQEYDVKRTLLFANFTFFIKICRNKTQW